MLSRRHIYREPVRSHHWVAHSLREESDCLNLVVTMKLSISKVLMIGI